MNADVNANENEDDNGVPAANVLERNVCSTPQNSPDLFNRIFYREADCTSNGTQYIAIFILTIWLIAVTVVLGGVVGSSASVNSSSGTNFLYKLSESFLFSIKSYFYLLLILYR